MTFSSTKANGNIRYYSEKHLQDLEFYAPFYLTTGGYNHYAYVAKNVLVYRKDDVKYTFAHTPKGYVFLMTGEPTIERLQIKSVSEKFIDKMFYMKLALSLVEIEQTREYLEIKYPPNEFITVGDVVDYLVEYYDIFQMVMADEESQGREASDSEPNFDMSKYIQTKSGNALSANALPFTITLPYHKKKITITMESVVIEALD